MSCSLRANQYQWQCENARPRLSGKFPYDMKGVSAVPRETNCLGEAAAPEFTVSKIVSEGNEEERGNQPDLIIQVSTQNQRLAVSDGRMDNEWMEGWIGRLAICAQEPTSRRFSDIMGGESVQKVECTVPGFRVK